jgi:hypothetical protein
MSEAVSTNRFCAPPISVMSAVDPLTRYSVIASRSCQKEVIMSFTWFESSAVAMAAALSEWATW